MFHSKNTSTIIRYATIFLLAFCVRPAIAQFGQGLLSGTYQAGGSTMVEVLRQYYKDHQHMPQNMDEIDDVLCKSYEAIGGCKVNLLNTPIESWNAYRILGSMAMKYDPSIINAPLDIYATHPPENWMLPGGKIVVLSDGNNGYLIWYATLSGGPMMDDNNHYMMRAGNFAPPAPATPPILEN